mgnify:CR=1 FL=1
MKEAEVGVKGEEGEEGVLLLSTLDVIADPWVGPRLLLLVDDFGEQTGSSSSSSGSSSNPWLRAAAAVAEELAAAGGGDGGGRGGEVPFVVVQVATTHDPEPQPRHATNTNTHAHTYPPREPRPLDGGPPYGSPERAYGTIEPPAGGVLARAATTLPAPATASPTPAIATAASVSARQQLLQPLLVVRGVAEAESGGWRRAMGVPRGSCLLVRPDGHVAWRHLGPPKVRPMSPGQSGAGAAVGEAGRGEAAVAAAAAQLRAVLGALHFA